MAETCTHPHSSRLSVLMELDTIKEFMAVMDVAKMRLKSFGIK